MKLAILVPREAQAVNLLSKHWPMVIRLLRLCADPPP